MKSGGAAGFEEWRACFAEVAPGLDVRFWDEMGDPGEVDFALVWDPEPGRLAAMPGLRCIFGAGAGVDLIVRDPDFPRHVPLVRMIPAGAAQRMGEYICWAALHVLRQGRRMALAQAVKPQPAEAAVMRDYFIARSPQAGLLWIYRERRSDAELSWFLHGIFA